jgi:hypothetical protein
MNNNTEYLVSVVGHELKRKTEQLISIVAHKLKRNTEQPVSMASHEREFEPGTFQMRDALLLIGSDGCTALFIQ